MNDEELVRLQVTLEYQVDGDKLIPFADSTEQARFIVYRIRDDYVRFYRMDIPVQLRLELERMDSAQVFQNPGEVQRILSAYSLDPFIGLYESCYFAELPQASDYPDVVRDGQLFEVRVGGETVSWAWSVRSNEWCAEVAVETLPGFQRRGYARQAVSALAATEMGRGKVVFYSFATNNYPSRALGYSLGVLHFASCAVFN